MSSVKQHYDQLLGAHYTWSVAGSDDPYIRGAAWLERHDLARFSRYLDLGAGFGAHAVPLARAGALVTAVDFHAGLLAELRSAAPSITTHEADLLSFLDEAAASPSTAPWDAVLCLGDTLTHLTDFAEVQRFLSRSARVVAPTGVLAVSYRDYSGPPRTGTDRFIPVRHDADRALLCLLEPLDADRISVTDIVTLSSPDGLRTQLSTYPKLRLAPATVAAWAASAGLILDRSAVEAGLTLQVFRPA